MAKWAKKDNTAPQVKAEIRQRTAEAMGRPLRVLDLFCGSGRMYSMVWRSLAETYQGVDIARVHSAELCVTMSNREYIARYGIGDANCFDLDAYGSPWLLAVKIATLFKGDRFALVVTDGTPQRQRFGQTDRLSQALAGIPRGFQVPGLQRWYKTILGHVIREIETRSGCRVEDGCYAEVGSGSIPNRYIGMVFQRYEPTIPM